MSVSTMASASDEPCEDLEEQASPSSAASLRQKMLQQRQRALDKQRAGTNAGNMVVANDGCPTAEVTGASGPSNVRLCGFRGQSASSSWPSHSNITSGGSSSSSGFPADFAVLEHGSLSSMSLGDKDTSGVIVPETCLERKEEEARRRSSLAQELDERGICPIYDPAPTTGFRGDSNFDISAINPSQMKSFLLSPAPKHAGMVECRITRERTGINKLFPRYVLESDCGVFLMTAKKQKHNKTSNYAVSMSAADLGKDAKDCENYLGKLRSNFLGLEFVSYGTGLNPKKIDSTMAQVHAIQLARQELMAVQYSSSLWGSRPRGPRKMSAVIPRVQPSGERIVCRTMSPETEGLIALHKAGNSGLIDCYHNKPPKWNDQIGAFVLNFNKRVTQASVKNFQLANQEDPDTVYLQFGRVGKDVFNMDFRHPFSPFQAFAICLSSFDYKLCCE